MSAEIPEDSVFYTLWTVFKKTTHQGSSQLAPEHSSAAESFNQISAELATAGVSLRGIYDVSAMRADADLMIWLHGEKPEELQGAVRALHRSELLAQTQISFSAMGVHREAEFAKNHAPAFARGVEPSNWVCVYPFVRSYDWYLMDQDKRGTMLRDHGLKGREYPQVLSNTVAAFALGDWEWILALEAPELTNLVDLMRHLRNTEARLYVREEIPFYTGRRISAEEAVEVLA